MTDQPKSQELMEIKPPSDDEIMYVVNPDSGMIEAINLFTGETLQSCPPSLFNISHIDGQLVVTPKDPGTKVPLYARYDERVMEVICNRLATEDNGITEICDGQKGYPSMIQLKRWLQAHPKAREMYDLALQVRGDRRIDKIEKELRFIDPKLSKKAEIEARKLKIDTNLKLAGFDNKERYSEKKQVDHKVSGEVGVRITLDTGIRRPGDAGYIIDETAKIQEAKRVEASLEDTSIESVKQGSESGS